MGVKLGDETRGYTRFRFLANLLCEEGFDVTLITTTFQHWEKKQRDTSRACYATHPFDIAFIDEPGYKKNLDFKRMKSHRCAAQNIRAFFQEAFASDPRAFDLVYCEIPPNDVALAAAEAAHERGIPFVADINDLWPEAMRMVVDIPLISDIAFYPFARDAARVYQLLDAAVGTSDEYALRPARDREAPYPHETVYVGNDLSAFDQGARAFSSEIVKPEGELWVTYAGTLGASYDIATFIEAAQIVCEQLPANAPRIRAKILGDGPDRERLEALAQKQGAPVDFLGYASYPLMAAYLVASDILINSLVKGAAQSIVTKIGDYLASGRPLINTGENPEFRTKVSADGFGVNVAPGRAFELADAIVNLAMHPAERKIMGAKARERAEKEFDQRISYRKIVDLIRTLL